MTDAQKSALQWLKSRGGNGYLDRYGRVVAGGDFRPQGTWTAWMNLMAWGMIAGSEGRVFITDAGERVLEYLAKEPK